jgi:magnesium and cobalt transporter
MKKVTSLLRRFFGMKGTEQLEQEIQSIIDAGEEKGLIDSQSGEMIQSILDFRETVVREVMIPRTEIVAIPSDAEIEEILEAMHKHGHTRMPVYRGNIDNIVGILNVKDLLKYWSMPVEEKDILAILRKPYFIPETKNTHELLHELKQKKYHMAIVIDEYGGTSGLVTLEDLVEEIVGEIHDEHDSMEGEFIDMPDHFTLVDGRIEIEKIEERFKITFPKGKYETLGGLILHTVKRIPLTGESFVIEGLEMIIDSANERSIRRVKIRKIHEEEKPD